MSEAYHLLFKMIIIGDSGVGKTCLCARFNEDRFDPRAESTLGVEFSAKTIVIDKFKIRVAVWDTAGQERFASVARSYYRGSACVVLAYDVSRRSTFESVSRWLMDAKTYCSDHSSNVVYVLLGNKIDVANRREITPEEGLQFARANNIAMFVETSALTGHLVVDMFRSCAATILERVLNRQLYVAPPSDDCNPSGVRAGPLGIDFVNQNEPSSQMQISPDKHYRKKIKQDGCCT